ncbi:hypothetical protein ABMA57_16870 [Saccharospirillum sp. HFRX-1]|uniref:hypothetical protein n=1 Tax=unclassified Saccharospirillum TaxID=2633430 RepID=UPI00371F66DF
MSSKGAVKESSAASQIAKWALVLAFILALGIALDEFTANTGDGEYRLSIWDRITGKEPPKQGRAEVSVQLAQELCRQQVRQSLGEMFIRAHFDNRSSRYNQELKVHTIFLDLEVTSGESGVYGRCDVSAVDRRILEYRVKGWSNPFWR